MTLSINFVQRFGAKRWGGCALKFLHICWQRKVVAGATPSAFNPRPPRIRVHTPLVLEYVIKV